MAVITIYRLAEETLKMISGGDTQAATNVSLNEVKIAIGQIANQLLKLSYITEDLKMGERIPEGIALGLYENIAVTQYGNKSRATLPIKPIKLPRGLGIFSVFRTADNEQTGFIPMGMGVGDLLKSQPLINGVLGQIAYENFNMELVFNKDLTILYPNETVSMRLAVFDINLYGDFDPLPILPEHEWQIKNEIAQRYSGEGVSDKLVDPTTAQQQNTPAKQQTQP